MPLPPFFSFVLSAINPEPKKVLKEYGGWGLAISLFLYFVVFPQIQNFFLDNPHADTHNLNGNQNTSQNNQTFSIENFLSEEDSEPEVLGIQLLEFEQNKEKWNLKELRESTSKKNMYCLRNPSGFDYQYAWYNKSVAVGDFKVKMRINLSQDSKFNDEERRFSVILGKENKLFETTFPVSHGQVLNFRQWTNIEASPQTAFFPESGKSLIAVIDPTAPIDIDLKSEVLNGKKIRLTLFLEFISTGGKKETDDFTYEIELHDPNPRNLLAEMGVGVRKGNCLEIVNFSID